MFLLQNHRVSEGTSKRGEKKDSKFDPRTSFQQTWEVTTVIYVDT